MKTTAIKGFTFIEILLVMIIAAIMLALGLQQYRLYKSDADIQQVEYSLDALFSAMSKYYWSNCNPPYSYDQDPCGTASRSPLVVCPATTTTTQNPVPINITTDLINNNFLQSSDLRLHTIIDQQNESGDPSALNGYTLQFKLFYKPDGNIPTRQFCKDNVCTTVAMIITWKMQISVKLTSEASTAANIYGLLLDANCVSDLADFCAVVAPPPGQPASAAPKYLIFTRYAGQINPNAQSNYWQMMPMVRVFKQEYENQPDWYLATNPSTSPKYYYCTQ